MRAYSQTWPPRNGAKKAQKATTSKQNTVIATTYKGKIEGLETAQKDMPKYESHNSIDVVLKRKNLIWL